MRRIVLPGYGTPVTFSPKEDAVVNVFTGGKRVPIRLTAGQVTRVEFLGSIQGALAA